MKIPLCCPACKSDLTETNANTLTCSNCKKTYPVFDGVPVLINDGPSVFTVQEIADTYVPQNNGSAPQPKANESKGLKHTLMKGIWFLQRNAPELSLNLLAKQNYQKLGEELLKNNPNPTVLIIGGRILGKGMEDLVKLPINFVESDVAFGPRTKVICDGHSLPFKDGYFDGVIMQAVIEYFADPQQVVAEVYRVLKPNGLVYAETPFMQQVHGREYDFNRYTYLGHRRLFRNFEQLAAGGGGTGSALAWSVKYLFLSFSDSKAMREIWLLIASYTAFVFKYFDYITNRKQAVLDGASGYYFLGKKSTTTLSDRDLIKLYKGGF